jgi:hypothetical protein
MLDHLSPEIRHLALMLLVAVCGYVAAEVLPVVDANPLLVGLAGAAITAVIAWATPLTRQYGLFKAAG